MLVGWLSFSIRWNCAFDVNFRTMADCENLKSFAALARSGTLSGAARLLTVDHATVARRIAALEEELGLRLVDRRGRHLLLTSAGKRVADLVGQMDTQAQAIERAATGERTDVAGEVTVSATPVSAAEILAEPIVSLRRSHPGLIIRILGETRYSSLVLNASNEMNPGAKAPGVISLKQTAGRRNQPWAWRAMKLS
jgi:DNA-binding transcriptional LysR family regulator